MIFVRLDRKTMVAGTPIPWDSPDLLQIMCGLCFASIDEALRPGLKNYLCEDYDADW